MTVIEVIVDNRLRIATPPPGLVGRLRKELTRSNPKYEQVRRSGRWPGGIPKKICTLVDHGAGISIPRGCAELLREACSSLGIRPVFHNRMMRVGTSVWPTFCAAPGIPGGERPYQEVGIVVAQRRQQGIVRMPTGAGKTLAALSLLPRLQQKSLVVVRDSGLVRQWEIKAKKHLGLDKKQLGIVMGGKRRVGSLLTVALQQSLWAPSFSLEEFAKQFGVVIVDEVQDAAARTVQEVIDTFPAAVRLGYSADHTRKDRMEFLIHDMFGPVIYEVGREQLEGDGSVLPVTLRLVPTRHRADWYRDGSPEERDFTRLIAGMVDDEIRNELLRGVVLELVAAQQVPAFVFTHRREHAQRLADVELPALGVPCGLMLGGDGATRFQEALADLESGRAPVAVGSFKAIGQGIDLPAVRAGVIATPIGQNRQFFNQVRGRICRPTPGKTDAFLYYLWDRDVFPRAPANLLDWCDGRVEVYDGQQWRRCDKRGDPV